MISPREDVTAAGLSGPEAEDVLEIVTAEDSRRFEVAGRVKRQAPDGACVRAWVVVLREGELEERLAAEAEVDAAGRYRMTFDVPASEAESADLSLTVRAYGTDGELLAQSEPWLAPPPRTRVDLRLRRARSGPCELTTLERQVETSLKAGMAGLADAEAEVVGSVSEWLGVDASRLSLLRRARSVAEQTGLPDAAWYAVGRAGLEMEPEHLLEVPAHELRTTIEEAVATGIVDAERLGDVDTVVAGMADEAVSRAVQGGGSPGLADVLAAADIPPETIEQVLRRYQARTATAGEFWDSFTEGDETHLELGADAPHEIAQAVRLGELLGVDPPLLRRVHARRRAEGWGELDELSRLDFDDWCALLREPGEGEGAEDESEPEQQEWVEARAGAILDALEAEFPSAFIRRRLDGTDELGAGARQLLDRAPRHDLVRDSIRARADSDPGLLEGLAPEEAEAALEEVEALERIGRVTERADEVEVLVRTGMRSALDIACTPRRQFIDLYAEALGGRPQAARVHAQAQQTAAGSKVAALRLLQAAQHAPAVLGAPPPDAIKSVPDARTLFQAAGGFCDCEHCGSVYSPAAYFVDLLRYLNVASPDRLQQIEQRLKDSPARPAIMEKLRRYQPLDVLLGRRPDLADLPLSCENTLTALPYIDLVNELLEAAVTGGSAAFDTGKVPADVLRAVPQNVSREAYTRLLQAVHPLALPYHQPLAVARAYLGHLGVTRLELMRALGRGEGLREALAAEALLMSFEEMALVVGTPAELWKQAGFAAEQKDGVPYVDALRRVPAFLDATGMNFQAVIDLVSTRFVNADDQLQLQSAAPDCNPETITIVGLDEARLSRMIRLVRLQRRLGWAFPLLDRALIALGSAELDLVALEKLAAAREVARVLDRPLAELLVLWAPMDTWGANNTFDRLFATRAVAWRAQDERTFQLQPDRKELAAPVDTLDGAASALLAAFRITDEDLALIRALLGRRGAPPRLDLAGLSAVYRVVILSRALQLRIPALDLLLRLTPPEADPLRPGDPAATLRFVEIVREVQASDFTPERLAYLFRHQWEPRRDPGPLAAQVDAVLSSLRRGLADAFAETSPPAQPTVEALRQKLGMVLDASLLDPAMEALDPRTALAPDRRREFFDRHLGRLFADPAAAAARLVSAVEGGTREALEERLKANITLVLEHLLPQLRARQLRGAVIQALADTLGLTAPATARLLDQVLRSRRRPGEPLFRDFLAMLGTGLTGSYFANGALQGEPAVVRTDAEPAFTWAGAPPAEGVPGREFSVRWTGHLLARAKAPHTFYVSTDGAVRLALKVDGAERVLIDRPPSPGGRVVEHVSEPVALDPRVLVELKLEYRNQGGPATLSLQFGTGPAAKQVIPTTHLFPADGLSAFTPVEESYRRLHKAAMIVTGFGMTDAQLEWLTTAPPFLDLDALPMAPPPDAEAAALFQRWRQLGALFALRRKLPRSNVDLFDVFGAATLPEALDRLVLATGWERGVAEAFLGPEGLGIASPADLRPTPNAPEPALVRLARAVELQRRVGVAPATLVLWANGIPDTDGAAAVVQAVKARYDEARWLEVAQRLNDPLRAERRDALVSYLLPRLREAGVRNRDQLFEYFLIDVDMNPCMLTSRVRQAIGTVQTFFQRCLMNLEPKVSPRIIDDNDWKWLKQYRVWEANRKIFLYPENWIEPELRDDKSPLFQALERTILQQEIKKENVEAAFVDYLEGLDEIARLDVRAIWFEARTAAGHVARRTPQELRFASAPRSDWDHGTYHVFGRTFNAPHVWYYRRLVNGRDWTPWEKIDADIEGDHLVPVIFQNRMHLFWTSFREVNKKLPKMDRGQKGPPPALGKDWEIHLAYSVYDRGRWTRKRMSSGGVVDQGAFLRWTLAEKNRPVMETDGTQVLSPRSYTLRAQVDERGDLPRLVLHLYCRAVEAMDAGGPRQAAANVELIARFELDGCNGALVPDRKRAARTPRVAPMPATVAARGPLRRGRPGRAPAIANVGRTGPGAGVQPFRLTAGGGVNAPAGYRVDGMRLALSAHGRSALLAMAASDAQGLSVALSGAHASRGRVTIVPAVDPRRIEHRGLVPFVFQDRFRSYFAKPVDAGWRPPRLVAVPLVARRPIALPPPATRRGRPAPRRRGGRGRREDWEGFEDLETLALEARDEWEDAEDEAWHPDDAAEARRPRRGPSAPPGRPAPRPPARGARRAPVAARAARPAPAPARVAPRVQAGFREQRLQFVPFEHPDTCRFLSTLKGKGIEGLLEFTTTRPRAGRDHDLDANGRWVRRPRTWFQARYGPGPLTDASSLPHLDVAFEAENPYSSYNWELFFHAPLQVAVRLAKDGRHEEAQRWFHFIFDPTTDSSAPSPRRYWRFAPFHANDEYDSARELVSLLAYGGKDPALVRRNAQARAEMAAWWEKPFSPHVIARLRIAAYQKAVVMKYIDNLVEWGDKLFRRDTLETIQEATQVYILAANILGPRPEKIPAIVSREPLTFRKMRHALSVFSNFEVRLENLQVRRPFRLSARPDVSGAAAVLGMATQYFCTPANPQLDKYWDTVADRLFKIRNCMNIQGVVRPLALFDPPIDPGLLVRAAAAGVDLGSVVASLNAPPPHYRFRYLLGRAVRLAEEIRGFGALTLQALERRDAEALAALRATHETRLLDAVRDIRKKQVRQVEEALAELSLEKEHVDMQAQHLTTQLAQLMNPQEEAAQKSLSAAQVISGVAEGVDLVAKVMHAIPEFQTGAAGGFSSPFVTLQLGGQMFGDIAGAFAASLEKVMSKNESEAELAAAQAEYQRRREEWQHELDLLNKEKAQVEKRIAEGQLKLEICSAELRRHELEVENARKIESWLRDHYTNEQLYGWMLGQLSGVYFQAYKVAFDAAQQAERAFRFERGDSSSAFVEFSYWDSLKKGLLAGERLLVDLRRLEAAHLEGDRRLLEVTRYVSLREDHPLALLELLSTGRAQVEVTEALLDGDFPGHYFRRIKTASLSMAGAFEARRNVNCTLTLLENRIRTDATASGAYAASTEGEDARFVVNLAPVQAVATSRTESDAGVFHLRFDDDRYLPFEGAGAISTWRIELRQEDNALDLSRLTDVVLTLSYTARNGGGVLETAARADREKGLARGGLRPPPQHLVSLKRDVPEAWKRLQEAPAGQDVEIVLPLGEERFPGRYRGLDLRIERVTAFAPARAPLGADVLRMRLDPPKGSGTAVAGWAPPWPRSRMMRGAAEVSGPAGDWKLAVGATAGKVPELVDDLLLVFDVRARRT